MTDSSPPGFEGVLETVLYFPPNLEGEMGHFYRNILGMVPLGAKEGEFLFFRAGRSVVLLFNPESSSGKRSPPPHGAEGPGHACFVVGEERYAAWKSHLSSHGREIEEEIEWPRGGRSFYFRDPAGNALEIADRDLWAA